MAVRKTTAAPVSGAITVLELDVGRATVMVRGTSPLFFNAMSAKAKRELLAPKGRKTAADKAQTLKHNPRQEYRDSLYRWAANDQPTRLKFPAPGFKQLLQTAALEVPGAKKAQIARLTWIEGEYISIYGIPKLHMGVVRSADIGRTPDIRTRAILDSWCCAVNISFTQPTLNAQVLGTLLAAGGLICGIGDFRQEKGSGSYGQFKLVSQDDEDFKRIMATGGREVQDAAILAAEPFDGDTEELLSWFDEELGRRGLAKAA